MSLTQYLESQEDQDMTRLLHFTRTQKKRREGDFLCPRMKEMGDYIVVVEEETLGKCLKGRGKEELGEEE